MVVLGVMVFLMVMDLGIDLGLSGPPQVSGERLTAKATVYLVFATGMYVFFTYGLLRETTVQRQQDIQPAFAAQVETDGLRITNVGNGAALQAEITFSLISKGHESPHRQVQILNHDLPAGEHLLIPYHSHDNLDGFDLEPSDEEAEDFVVKISGNYIDVHQNQQAIEEREYSFDISHHKLYTDSVEG